MSINKLVSFYDRLLESLGCSIDSDTREVYFSYDGEDTPVYVKRKRLIAINPTILKNGLDTETQVGFHPLSESATAGMADVHQWILAAINLRLNTYVANVASRIAMIASSQELQSKMKPKELSHYKLLTDVDSKIVSTVTGIIDKMDITDRHCSFVHVRCKRSGTLGGKAYGRVTYVTFPILDEIENASHEGTIFDKPIRKKDIRALKTIFQDIILNNRTAITDFSSGNTTTTAPYLSSMLTAFNNVLVRLNSLQRSQGDQLKCTGLPADTSWYPEIGNFVQLQKAVPQMDGNVGTTNSIQEQPSRKRVPKEVDYDDEHEDTDVSGIARAIETTREEPVKSTNPFRAVPIKDGMGINPVPTLQVNNNPFNVQTNVQMPDPSKMSVEQYMAVASQGNNFYTGHQQQSPLAVRGRDAYEQRRQMQMYGYATTDNNGFPVVGGTNTHVNQNQYIQQQQQPQLVNINGQLHQIVPVQQTTVQTHGVQPSGPSGMFEGFAK